MDTSKVYYVKGVGFVLDWKESNSRHFFATDAEIGRALRTGRLYNTSNIKLVNERQEIK